MRVRRACRTDDNQSEIVEAFESLGCSVAITSSAGDGFPDLVVGRNRVSVLVEVKDGRKPPSKRKLTSDQQVFHNSWKGSVEIVETLNDVVEVVSKYFTNKKIV